MIVPDILGCIGRTPVIRLSRLFPEPEVYAKAEFLNPGGSIKDRPAWHIIEAGLADGSIPRGAHIIESSSGNMAIALAMVCKLRGLRFTAVVDPKITPANLRIIRSFGGDIIEVCEKDENGGYLGSRIRKIRHLLRGAPDMVWINQYANERNCLGHYHGEGAELLEEFPEAATCLVLGVSTSGTIHGVGRRLREAWPSLRVVAVDAAGSVLFGGTPAPRDLPGIGASCVPPLLRRDEIDDVVQVDDFEAATACRQLAKAEGLFVGGSSGAVAAAIGKLAGNLASSTRILTVFPDRGERYLDTVYDDAWLAEAERRHFQAPGQAPHHEPGKVPHA